MRVNTAEAVSVVDWYRADAHSFVRSMIATPSADTILFSVVSVTVSLKLVGSHTRKGTSAVKARNFTRTITSPFEISLPVKATTQSLDPTVLSTSVFRLLHVNPDTWCKPLSWQAVLADV